MSFSARDQQKSEQRRDDSSLSLKDDVAWIWGSLAWRVEVAQGKSAQHVVLPQVHSKTRQNRICMEGLCPGLI